jgi:tetratricopeptide (TPR) repeat protein
VEREPEYAPALSALATLYCQMYTMDVPGFDRPLETGLEYARRAVTLAPQAQLCHLIMAYASYLAEDDECFREEAGSAIELNPNSPYTAGAIGYFHALRGDLDLALPLIDRAIAANPFHPAWFRAVYVIGHLLRSDYDAALADTRKHLPFISFWDDVLQAAILGKLGRVGEASPHVDRLRRSKPDFEERARELFGRALKIEPLVDDLVDGLRAVGMRVDGRGRSPWPVVSQAGDG